MFSDIFASGQRMLTLVNGLLDVSQIESAVGSMPRQGADIAQLVREAVSQVQPKAVLRDLKVNLKGASEPVEADVDRVRRLERLIEQRTKALSRARDEAVAASHSKSSFLAYMSHEIRTPLTSIIGFAELLQDPQVPKSEKVDAAKTIVRNGRYLLEVINDILDMSKIESNQLKLERIEVGLPKLLSDVEALASSRAQEKGLLFTISHHLPLPPALLTDPVRLKQILLNFCSNAIKFSKDAEVRLDVHFDAGAKTPLFEVTDSGIGMSEREMARRFKPFVRADVSTTRKFGGTGLGLVAATTELRNSNYRGPIVALTANVMQDDVALYRNTGCTDVLGKPIVRKRFYEVLEKYVGQAQAIRQSLSTIRIDDYDAELGELTAEFASGLPATLANIERAARSEDLHSLKMLLHTLKGTSGSYGFTEIYEIAKQAEAGVGTLNTDEPIVLCARLSTAILIQSTEVAS